MDGISVKEKAAPKVDGTAINYITMYVTGMWNMTIGGEGNKDIMEFSDVLGLFWKYKIELKKKAYWQAIKDGRMDVLAIVMRRWF